MKKGILGMIGGLALSAAGLLAQPTGFGVAVGRGGGVAVPALIEQFQQAGTIAAVAGGRGLTVINGNSRQTVIGRPVSATEEQKSTQTLSDGTEIATAESDRFYRDSAGRTRVEMTSQGRIVIVDPVARATVTLNTASKIARRNALPASLEPRMGVAFPANAPAKSATSTYSITIGNTTATVTSDGRGGRGNPENTHHEDLGLDSLNGVLAAHTRDILTIPQGQIGNNRDIHVVNERWYSDDLQMLVKTVNTDPRFGENTYELTNISRDEPSASLFQIPADYRVVDVGSTLFPATPAITIDK